MLKKTNSRKIIISALLSEINNNPRLEGFNNLLTLYLKNEEKKHSLDQLEKIFESFLISIENKKKVNWTNLLNDSKNSSFIIIGLKQQFLNNSSFSDFYNFLNNLIKNSKNKTKIEFTGGLVIDYEEMKSVSKGASKAVYEFDFVLFYGLLSKISKL